MFQRLLAAFILVPLIELMLLIQVAKHTSFLTTIMLVIITGIIGSWLARREGTMTWFRFQSALSEGRVPSSEIQDGLMIVFAAALLLTPGLLTDAIGFTLLVPQGRELVRKTLLRRYMEKFQMRFYGPEDFTENSFQQNNEDCSQTIDADHFERKPD